MTGGARRSVVVLAAGQGTRMRSARPKILHDVCGRPMIEHVLDVARRVAGDARPVVVVSPATREPVAGCLGEEVELALQAVPRGTADAIAAALPAVPSDPGTVVVLSGDVPLVDAALVERLAADREAAGAAVALIAIDAVDPASLGRVVRDAAGRVARIVEARDATPAELAVREVNAGIYAFERAWLHRTLPAIAPSPVTGELYLPDLVALAAGSGAGVVVVAGPDDGTLAGVNDRIQLADAERVLRRRIIARHQLAGVTVLDPDTTWIDDEVELAEDVTIEPGVFLRGRTVVGRETTIGAGSELHDTQVGARCTIRHSVLEDSVVGDDVRIGPFAHLRSGATIGDGVELGNYAEVKASTLGPGTKQHHFSYVGDAVVGANVNIGAGTVTANYDGRAKHRTTIGDGAFIGSDTILRAPVAVGRGAATGAGSVVTRDVPDGITVAGVPARELRRAGAPTGEDGA